MLGKHRKARAGGKSGGFTILETLVAITIIVLSISGPLVIVSQSLKSSYFSRDEITAFYLAQEAIEFARNQRDKNALPTAASAANWLDGVTSIGGVSCVNNADLSDVTKQKCSLVRNSSNQYLYESCGVSCGPLLTYPITEVYGAPAGTAGAPVTNFTREVYFTRVPLIPSDTSGSDQREIIMTVRIAWTNNTGSNEYVVNERLFNWKTGL